MPAAPKPRISGARKNEVRKIESKKLDGRSTRWTEHREATREHLIRSVIGAIQQHGAGVGMDQIAAAAKTSKTVFYRYFSDKGSLRREVGRVAAERVMAEVIASLETLSGDPAQMIAVAIDTYLRCIEAEPELYRFVVHPPSGDGNGPGSDPVAEYTAVVEDKVASLIGDRLRDAGFDTGAAEPWAVAVVGMARAAGDRWLARPTISRKRLVEYLAQLAWFGMLGSVTAGYRFPAEELKSTNTAPTAPTSRRRTRLEAL